MSFLEAAEKWHQAELEARTAAIAGTPSRQVADHEHFDGGDRPCRQCMLLYALREYADQRAQLERDGDLNALEALDLDYWLGVDGAAQLHFGMVC